MDVVDTVGARLGRSLLQAALLVLAGAVLGLACNALRPHGLPWTPGPNGSAPGTPAQKAIPPVGVMEAWRDYQKGLVLFVDARSPAEYRAGHLPGAVSVPVEEAGAKQGRMGLPEGRELVIYCSDPECPKSAQLASLLLERGVSGIKVMTGGWAAWYEAGLPADELGGE